MPRKTRLSSAQAKKRNQHVDKRKAAIVSPAVKQSSGDNKENASLSPVSVFDTTKAEQEVAKEISSLLDQIGTIDQTRATLVGNVSVLCTQLKGLRITKNNLLREYMATTSHPKCGPSSTTNVDTKRIAAPVMTVSDKHCATQFKDPAAAATRPHSIRSKVLKVLMFSQNTRPPRLCSVCQSENVDPHQNVSVSVDDPSSPPETRDVDTWTVEEICDFVQNATAEECQFLHAVREVTVSNAHWLRRYLMVMIKSRLESLAERKGSCA